MERHCSNALAIAIWPQGHHKVAWVNYPGLEGKRYVGLAKKYPPKGAGAILTFGILPPGQYRGREESGHHPASTTHRQLSEEQQIAAGVRRDLIRLSVGLESLDDIVWGSAKETAPRQFL